jgi:hypothetical protein
MGSYAPAQSLYFGINLIMMIETLMSEEAESLSSQFVQVARLFQTVY